MKKQLLLGVALGALVLASPALAADMPVKAPVYKAPVANWTGCYVGGNIGYGWANKHWYDTTLGLDAGSHTATGVVGGGQLGCDYQTGNWVLGVQGMFDWAGLEGNHNNPIDYEGSFFNDKTKVTWFATLTGRAGYLVQPAALLYVKGGAAWVHDKYWDTEIGNPANFGFGQSTRAGWTVGGGLEYKFQPNWSAFIEYDYMDFGTRTETLTYGGGSTYDYDIKQRMQVILVGVNYRFH